MLQYHDREWGVPVHDDRKHFEFLVLEAAQAGLSWSIVLKKREAYRLAFSDFDPEQVARYAENRIQKLTLNPAIIRNRMKIEAAVRNAQALLAIQEELGSFDAYCWRFVEGRPKLNRWKAMREIPATSHESDAFSKDLKHRGFSFVGSIPSFMRTCRRSAWWTITSSTVSDIERFGGWILPSSAPTCRHGRAVGQRREQCRLSGLMRERGIGLATANQFVNESACIFIYYRATLLQGDAKRSWPCLADRPEMADFVLDHEGVLR
jgi:DNA-3-methyladenine glycosylase I